MYFKITIESCTKEYALFLRRLTAFVKKECESGTLETTCQIRAESRDELISSFELADTRAQKL